MTSWTILGIEPTTDHAAVKRAYMTMLPKNNPEDNPEGFTRLRTAYEQILKELNNPSKPDNQPETPLTSFINRLVDIYNDFPRRCNTEEWKQMLQEEVCMRLDLEDETGIAVLSFFMSHYYIPHPVWVAFNNHFDWQSKVNILKQSFPANFIDFIISSVQCESLRYDLFDLSETGRKDDVNYDRWLWLFYEIEASIYAPPNNGFLELNDEIDAMPIKHPYRYLQQARIHIHNEEPDTAFAITQPLFNKYPDDPRVQYVHGLSLVATGQADKALDIFRQMPDDFPSKKGTVEALVSIGDKADSNFEKAHDYYEDARNILLQILDEYPYNAFALHFFRLVTEKLTDIYEKEYDNDPKNTDTILTLAKHYLNGYNYEKCKELLSKKEPKDKFNHARYYEYLADCYAIEGDFKTAISLYKENITLEKTYRNYVKYISTLIDAKMLGQALVVVEEALLLQSDDSLSLAYIYDNRGVILHKLKRYHEALESFDKGLVLNSQAAHIYVHKAKSYKAMGRFAESIECCEKAITIFPYHEESYTIQMKIYLDANLYEKIIELCNFAKDVGFENEEIENWRKRAEDTST